MVWAAVILPGSLINHRPIVWCVWLVQGSQAGQEWVEACKKKKVFKLFLPCPKWKGEGEGPLWKKKKSSSASNGILHKGPWRNNWGYTPKCVFIWKGLYFGWNVHRFSIHYICFFKIWRRWVFINVCLIQFLLCKYKKLKSCLKNIWWQIKS